MEYLFPLGLFQNQFIEDKVHKKHLLNSDQFKIQTLLILSNDFYK